MCTFVDSEVVLLNSLRCDVENKGIEYQDIRNYCERVKKMLFAIGKEEINCVSFQISNSSLEEDVETYPRLFRYYCGKYYRGVGYDPNVFDRRNGREINRVLKEAAQ